MQAVKDRGRPRGVAVNVEGAAGMEKSLGRFLLSFLLFVASAATLIVLLPGVVQSTSDVSVWLLVALGALAAVSASHAWIVNPTR